MNRLGQLRRTLRSPLARRLILGLALFSAAVTLVLTTAQLYREYRGDLDALELQLDAVRRVHLASLTQSTWATNQKDVDLLLRGIVWQTHIEYAAVLDGKRVAAEAGQRLSRASIERRYPMVYTHLGKPYQVGTLVVAAGLDPILAELKDRAASILANTAATIFLLAGFAFVLLHRLLTRHLLAVAEYVHGLDLSRPADPLRLLRRTRAEPDELDDLVAAINGMQAVNRASLAVLRESEARIRLLLDSTEEGIYGVNTHGRCTFVNPACLRMLGYEHEEDLLGQNLHELIHHSRVDGRPYPQADCRVRQSAAEGAAMHADDEVYWRRDGSSFPVEYWSHPMFRDGELMGAVVTFLDISKRRQDEAAVRLSEARLAEAQRITHMGSWELDLTTGKLAWSDEVYRIFELDPGRFAASYEAFVDSIHPDDRALVNQAYADSVRDHAPYDLDHRLLMRDGRIKYVREICETYYDDNGKPIRSLGTVQDITDIKQAEAELQRYRLHLEDMVANRTAALNTVNRELESFAYSVSHDLRGPLRGIDGFSQALSEDYGDKLDATGRDYLRRVRAAAQRMGQIIDDLLRLSRVSRAPLQAAPVDLSTLARDILGHLREGRPDRQVTVQVQDDLEAECDPGLLRVVLENLLGNAWKYTGKQEAARIEFGRTRQDGEDIFFVRDNGVGFDMQYADKLFGAFQRLHHPSEFEGTGIGLATVQRVVHRHGGRAWAESQPGQGAVVYFTLAAPAKISL
ncbi:MAG: PAS domain S-box protein [Betaproteobacteria bacterium]|nr:PAS domain S-box protein [Betaproteobacteria bacterium]